MAKLDLSKYGITGTTEVVYNPSYEQLFEEETKPGLEGYEKGQVSELGAVNVMTGIYTGRSPKDKFIVMDENSKDTVWWTSDEYKNDNHPASQEAWAAVKEIAKKELSNKRLYVVDAFCGANKDTRMAVRFIMEVAWQAHFVTNMFIKPTAEELENFEPDFVVYNASKAKVENYKELGLNSETAVMFNITSKEQVIVNTWYGGEMKKGMFSMMNYFLPLKGMASMHCSANTDMEGKNTAIFFGLSGTGKTTLSTDPKRLLIGDDEHGWDDNGVFNFEGGCYAKVINLDKDSEPDIYNAIKRNALLENVSLDAEGHIDFADKSVTENTRVSYPINHIQNIVRPISSAPAAKNVIFLSADAFGVLPPVSILTPEQTQYYFLSGFTAKLAGTERGITEPTPTFSACFGQALDVYKRQGHTSILHRGFRSRLDYFSIGVRLCQQEISNFSKLFLDAPVFRAGAAKNTRKIQSQSQRRTRRTWLFAMPRASPMYTPTTLSASPSSICWRWGSSRSGPVYRHSSPGRVV